MTYLSLEAELHDVMWAEQGPPAELPLLESFLKDHPGEALEIGCGSGRLLFPLLEKGYSIEGLDYSPDMLALAREKADALGLSPILHEGDMEELSLGKTFSAIALPAFTFNLARDPLACLKKIREHLLPGGGLYLSVFIPWVEIVGEVEPGEWFDDDGHVFEDGRSAICRTRIEIDRIAQRLTREHHYRLFDHKDALIQEHQSRQELRWFWLQEMTLLLEKSGFEVEAVLQDFEEAPAADGAPHVLTFLAKHVPTGT